MLQTLMKCRKTTNEVIKSIHNIGHHIISDRALSGGLVLSEWAGITTQNAPNGVAGIQLLVGVYSTPSTGCYDIVVDIVRRESYDMCAVERRDWHALGESWKSMSQQVMKTGIHVQQAMKTGIHVPTKCSGKELSQSGVCDDAFLSGYYANGKRSTNLQRKTTLSWFSSPQDNEELNCIVPCP